MFKIRYNIIYKKMNFKKDNKIFIILYKNYNLSEDSRKITKL